MYIQALRGGSSVIDDPLSIGTSNKLDLATSL